MFCLPGRSLGLGLQPAAAQRKWNMIIKSTNGKTRKDEKHNQKLNNNNPELPQEKTELREQFCQLCYIPSSWIYPSPFVFPVTIKVWWLVFSSNFPRHLMRRLKSFCDHWIKNSSWLREMMSKYLGLLSQYWKSYEQMAIHSWHHVDILISPLLPNYLLSKSFSWKQF